MRINKIELENITTHKDTIIEFKDGINVFLGKNGSGKSTVLKMIGFVLFDWMPNSQASYVTSNSKYKTGKATVWFTGSDNKDYKVERSVGISKFDVTDVAINKVIKSINKIDDLKIWLKEMFNLDPSYDLDSIFENSVGVEQGTFTAPFLLTPNDRKKIFDPILKVDAYEELYEKLQPVYKSFEIKANELEKNIATLEGQLGTKVEDAIKLEQKLKEITEIQAKIATQLTEQKKIKQIFDELKKNHDEINLLEKELAQLREQKKNIEDQIQKKDKEITESLKSKTIVQENKEKCEKYINIESEQKKIEKEIQELEIINDKIHVLEKSLAVDTQSILERTKSKKDIEEQAKDLDRLKIIIEKSKKLDESIKNLERKLGEIKEKERSLKEDLKIKENTIREIKSLEKELESILNIDELEKKEEELHINEKRLTIEIENLKHTKKEYETNRNDLKGGQCPFLHENCKNLEGKSLQDHFNKLIEELTPKIANKEKDLADLVKSLGKILIDIKSTRELSKKQIILNEKKRKLEELDIKIKTENEILSTKDTTNTQISELRIEYKNYEEDRNKYQVVISQMQKLEEIKKEVERLQNKCSQYSTEIDSYKIKISPLSGLKETKKSNQLLIEQYRSSYDLYNQNLKTADLFETRTNDLISIKKQQSEFLIHYKEKEERYDQLIKSFKQSEFNEIQEKKDSLREEISALNAQSSEISKIIEELKGKMQKYDSSEQELKNKKADFTKIQEIQSLVSKMRIWFRESRPKITKFLLNKIGTNASSIFQNIMENSSSYLEWKEDYQLLVHTPNSDKMFNQLSGGEQMAAALSIRLSLLQTISSIDFAFFDEPTTNLDAEKRRNLANCIQNIKGFKQLFIISHDDTFEGMADHVITFEKNNEEITVVK